MTRMYMVLGWDIASTEVSGPYDTEEAAREAAIVGVVQKEHRGVFPIDLMEIPVEDFEE